jgi:hypothetical protein
MKKYISILTEVSLDVDDILDNLNRVDYDHLIEGLISRRIIQPNDHYIQKIRSTTPREKEYLEALDKLKDKYYLLDEEFIHKVLELARKL